MRLPTGKRLLRAAMFQSSTAVSIKLVLGPGLEAPPLSLRCEHSDMCFVLKVKVECALRMLREMGRGSGGDASSQPSVVAEDLELYFRGVLMRDMMAIDKCTCAAHRVEPHDSPRLRPRPRAAPAAPTRAPPPQTASRTARRSSSATRRASPRRRACHASATSTTSTRCS